MSTKRRVAVVIDLEWPLGHHQQTFAGIHQYAAEHGDWDCSINPFLDLAGTQRASRTAFDGIIGRIPAALARQAKKRRLPLVNVWLNSPARDVVSVVHDPAEAGRMAGRHFLARGFRNFGYLGIDPDRTSQLQFSGLREVLDAAGMECDACWVERLHPEDKSSWQRFEKNLGQWIDGLAPPIAVFATTDLLARYIAESARERGLRMPGDVALTGAGNEVAICTTPEPSLSSIDYDFMRIGRRAAEVLDHLMDGKPAGREPIHLPPSQLVVRTSSGAFAVDQPIVTEALSYIGENLGQPLGVDHIAERVATTPRTLTRLFRKSLGKSVYQTITQLRLERVKRDLLESDDLLKAIAPRCGFRDAIHLCKVFQREEGITPSEYRTLRKQGKQ